MMMMDDDGDGDGDDVSPCLHCPGCIQRIGLHRDPLAPNVQPRLSSVVFAPACLSEMKEYLPGLQNSKEAISD